MYDDFWSGYNYGNSPGNLDQDLNQQPREYVKFSPSTQQEAQNYRERKAMQQAGVYDKSKFTKMKGPAGEQAEIYANGKMYIILPTGQSQVRTFPSRPWGIRYMQKRGWVLV